MREIEIVDNARYIHEKDKKRVRVEDKQPDGSILCFYITEEQYEERKNRKAFFEVDEYGFIADLIELSPEQWNERQRMKEEYQQKEIEGKLPKRKCQNKMWCSNPAVQYFEQLNSYDDSTNHRDYIPPQIVLWLPICEECLSEQEKVLKSVYKKIFGNDMNFEPWFSRFTRGLYDFE